MLFRSNTKARISYTGQLVETNLTLVVYIANVYVIQIRSRKVKCTSTANDY